MGWENALKGGFKTDMPLYTVSITDLVTYLGMTTVKLLKDHEMGNKTAGCYLKGLLRLGWIDVLSEFSKLKLKHSALNHNDKLVLEHCDFDSKKYLFTVEAKGAIKDIKNCIT